MQKETESVYFLIFWHIVRRILRRKEIHGAFTSEVNCRYFDELLGQVPKYVGDPSRGGHEVFLDCGVIGVGDAAAQYFDDLAMAEDWARAAGLYVPIAR